MDQGLAKHDGPLAKSRLLPLFVIKVSLEHSHAHLFMFYP